MMLRGLLVPCDIIVRTRAEIQQTNTERISLFTQIIRANEPDAGSCTLLLWSGRDL